MKQIYIAIILIIFFIATTTFRNPTNLLTGDFNEGSVVIAMVTPDTVWLESDTRAVYTDNLTGKLTYLKTKKIFQKENYFFGFTGLGTFDYPGGRLEPPETVSSIIDKGGNFDQVFYSSCIALRIELAKYVASQTGLPNPFLESHINKGYFTDFCLISFVNGKPVCKSLGFGLRSVLNRLEVYPTDTAMNTKPFEIMMSGHRNEIRKYIFANRMFVNSERTDLKNRIACLINLQASKDSMVGMPIDIYSIYNGGSSLEKDVNECSIPEISNLLNPNRKYILLIVAVLLLGVVLLIYRHYKRFKAKKIMQKAKKPGKRTR